MSSRFHSWNKWFPTWKESDDEIIANVTLLVQGRANHNFYRVLKNDVTFWKCAL